jgi:V8-like Glu-specific endopeptidase
MEYLETYLQHYRLIDPEISGEVPISPNVFSEVSFLYNRFWLVRALFKTCPDFGRRQVEKMYHKLESQIQAYQASLPSDPNKIERFTEETEDLLEEFHQINNRQAFYTQAVAAAKTEPEKDKKLSANKGVVNWGYGFQRGNMPGVEVSRVSDSVSKNRPWAGTHDHVFSYRDTNKVIVGWDLVCDRNDGHNGGWHKVSERIVGQNSGHVYVHADYGRAYRWSITWYVVDADRYPTGPWAEELIHAPEFSQFANSDGALEYWTPERMREARPIDLPIATPDELPEAEQSIVGGAAGVQRSRGRPPSERPDTLGDPDTSRVPDLTKLPGKAVGRLFFTLNGQDLTASASVVNGLGIMAAAHSLYSKGALSSNVVFVPAYKNRNEPFGKWEIASMLIPATYKQDPKTAYDLAFCTVRPLNGRYLGDVVGSLGIEWGYVTDYWNTMGYPAVRTSVFPFNGEEPWQSLGSQVKSQASTRAKKDNLTEGASGAPWLMKNDQNMVNGVFSAYLANPPEAHGPEFGGWVGNLYNSIFPE